MGLNRAIVAQLVSLEELFIFLRLKIQQSNWVNMYVQEERMSALCPLKKSPSSEALAIQEENKWIMICWKRHIFTQNTLTYLKISTFTCYSISHSWYSWGYILANAEVALEYNVIVHEKNRNKIRFGGKILEVLMAKWHIANELCHLRDEAGKDVSSAMIYSDDEAGQIWPTTTLQYCK